MTMSGRKLLAVVVLGLLLPVSRLDAQDQPPRVVNPEAVGFTLPNDAGTEFDSFRVELFRSGSDTQVASAVTSVTVAAEITPLEGRRAWVNIGGALGTLSDGEYVATIRTVGDQGESRRSVPSAPFGVVSPLTAPLPPAEARQERFWTRVGIAIGAAAILIPFLLR